MKYALIKIGGKANCKPRSSMFVIHDEDIRHVFACKPFSGRKRWLEKKNVFRYWNTKPTALEFAQAKRDFLEQSDYL